MLSNLSFTVRPGESIGIIGDNGSGKTTLLRILAGILHASSGTLRISGRVTALLDLNVGFNPELSGKENISFQGMLFGVPSEEMDAKLEDIIAFSELGDFINRPLKSYSAGMLGRLGFSIAVNLDPDILLIDEVLSVGDNYFQGKCFKRIKEFKEKGKTIVFISHSLGTVRSVCDRVFWLHEGQFAAQGEAWQTIDRYLDYLRSREGRPNQGSNSPGESIASPPRPSPTLLEMDSRRSGTREAEITQVQLLDAHLNEKKLFRPDEAMTIRISYHAHQAVELPDFGVAIYRNDGVLVYGSSSRKDGFLIDKISGKGIVDFHLPHLSLLSGSYEVTVAIFDEQNIYKYDYHTRLYPFTAENSRKDEGIARIGHYWEIPESRNFQN